MKLPVRRPINNSNSMSFYTTKTRQAGSGFAFALGRTLFNFFIVASVVVHGRPCRLVVSRRAGRNAALLGL